MKDWECEMKILPIGKGRKLKDGSDLAIISIGPIGNTVTTAIKELEDIGYSIAHYDIIFLKPIDKDLLNEIASKFTKVITVENGVIAGGLGSAVLEHFSENDYNNIEVTRVGLPDEFITHGSIAELNKLCEIDVEGMKKRIVNVLKNEKIKAPIP